MYRVKLTPGKIFRDVRKYYHIDKDSMCHGIVTEQAYYRFESGQIEPDGLLFVFLWERMGLALSRVNTVFTENELEWCILKYRSFEAVRNKDIEELVTIKNRMTDLLTFINESIGIQWIEYLEYASCILSEGFSSEAYNHIKRAVYSTMQDPYETDLIRKRFGECEIQILSAFFSAEFRMYPAKVKKIHSCIKSLKENIKENIPDAISKSVAFSRIAALEIHCFGECEDAEDISKQMANAMSIYDLPYILCYIGNEGKVQQSRKYKIWSDVLMKLSREFYAPYQYREELVFVSMPHINQTCDFIRKGRVDRGMTQENTSEGICEPETYSRIETGKRIPHRSNLKKILEKLDLEWGYNQGIIITDKYECVIRRLEGGDAMNKNEYEKCTELISYLEDNLNMEIPQNRQYCGEYRAILEFRTGKVSIDDTIHRLEGLLYLTGAVGKIERYYSVQEESIMLTLINYYRKEKKNPIKAKEIIDMYLDNEKRKPVPNVGRILQFKRLLAGVCCDLEKWGKEGALAREGLRVIFELNDAEMIEQFLDLLAESVYMEKKEEAKRKELLIEAIYMADLYGEKHNANLLRTFFEGEIDPDYIWY